MTQLNVSSVAISRVCVCVAATVDGLGLMMSGSFKSSFAMDGDMYRPHVISNVHCMASKVFIQLNHLNI